MDFVVLTRLDFLIGANEVKGTKLSKSKHVLDASEECSDAKNVTVKGRCMRQANANRESCAVAVQACDHFYFTLALSTCKCFSTA